MSDYVWICHFWYCHSFRAHSCNVMRTLDQFSKALIYVRSPIKVSRTCISALLNLRVSALQDWLEYSAFCRIEPIIMILTVSIDIQRPLVAKPGHTASLPQFPSCSLKKLLLSSSFTGLLRRFQPSSWVVGGPVPFQGAKKSTASGGLSL